MNLFDLFEGAIDDLEARRIEDLEAKMDDLTARAKATDDPKAKLALRHEFAKHKAERDSYYKLNVEEEIDTNYTYTVFIDGTKEGTYGSKEEAKAVVKRKKEQAPGREYTIRPKSRTSMSSIKKFQRNRDREIEEDDLITAEGYASTIGPDMAPLDPAKQWKINVRQLIADYIKNPQGLYNIAKQRGPNSPEAFAYNQIIHPTSKIPLPPDAVTFEGWQDFNKVEPYAVCLAGKPVKKFDYYEQARRFHDNWKQKLYREGNTEKADKITLMPLNLDEAANPAQQAAIAIAKKKAHTKPKQMDEASDRVDPILIKALNRMPDGLNSHGEVLNAAYDAYAMELGRMRMKSEYGTTNAYIPQLMNLYKEKYSLDIKEDTGSWIAFDPATKQIKKRFKTHTAGKSYAKVHNLGFASSEYYFDNVKEKDIAEDEQIDGMARGEVKEIIRNASTIQQALDQGISLDGWMYSYVTTSNDHLNSVAEQIGNPDIEEASMTWAAHKSTGPKFGGYLKGTDPAPTEFSKKSVGGMEEGIDGNMTVRSNPLSQPLRKRNYVAKNAQSSGAGKHNNNLKAAAARGQVKHKAKAFELDEMTNDDIAKLRADADARIKQDIDKQSNARIAAIKNPPKEKSFMQQVGDKQIGMVKGAWKGLTGQVEEDDMEEGWKNTVAGAALAGAAALGAGGAHAGGVSTTGQGFSMDDQLALNQQMQQRVQQQYDQAQQQQKPQAPTAQKDLSAFGTEYLQKVADGQGGRAMVSVADAKAELAARANGTSQQAPAPVKAPAQNNGQYKSLGDYYKANPGVRESSDNFLSWAVRNGYNFTKDPAIYESAKKEYKALVESKKKTLSEAKGLGKKVRVVSGPAAGQTGTIGEVRNGAYQGAPKYYTVDLDNGGHVQVRKEALKLIKDDLEESLKDGEYFIWTVYFDNGTSKRIKVKSDEFDPYAYYARQNQVVVNVDYDWAIHQ